jgi:hypothetical protein
MVVTSQEPKEFASDVFHKHYDIYKNGFDEITASLLAKSNSLMYVCAMIDAYPHIKFFIDVKLELELM